MAIWGDVYCFVCRKTEKMSYNPSRPPLECGDCAKKKNDERLAQHLKVLDKMTLEERVRWMEKIIISKVLLLVTCLALVTGCGKTKIHEANEIIALFEEMGQFETHVVVSFGPMPERAPEGAEFAYSTSKGPSGRIVRRPIGYCQYSGWPVKSKIVLDKDFWEKANECQKELLVFHELGHCSLRRGHRDGLLGDRCPASVMNKSIISCNCYNSQKGYYWQELFESDKARDPN